LLVTDQQGAAHVMTDAGFDFGLLTRGGVPLQRYEAGQKIFVQDDDGSCMYVVRSGKVKIMASGVVLESIGPNGIFGEMALIDGSPRSATAVASEPTELAPIDRSTFIHLVQHTPVFALQVMQMLATRIRRMNESL
jgi:CRP-like cAMP-binding protein